MQKTLLVISLLSMTGLAACSGEGAIGIIGTEDSRGDSSDRGEHKKDCTSECSKKMDKPVCSGATKYKECTDVDGDGCYEWVTSRCEQGTTCVDGVCIYSEGNPDPGENDQNCKDECSAGAVECFDDSTLRVCKDGNGDGCLEWVSVSCGAQCKDDVCVKDGECENECESTAVECDSKNAMRTCMDGDGDGCLENVITPCAEGTECSGGQCVPTGKQCTSECDEGKTLCDGTAILKTCKDTNGDGCFEWSGENCAEGSECRDNACSVAVPPCADTCDKNECDGTVGYKECKDSDGDGCREFGKTVSCAGGQVCEGGSCVTPQPTCKNACTAGDKQCSDKKLQECKDANGDGCTEWVDGKTCDYKCENKACVSNPNAWVPACTTSICPVPITDLSKPVSGNTSNSKNVISKYTSCTTFNKTTVSDESGPEDYYVVNITESGYLVAGVTCSGSVDVDVHILTALDGSKCLARGDVGAGTYVKNPGVYYISVDTYSGAAKAGDYKLKVTFIPDSGKCGMINESMPRYKACSNYTSIPMPVTAGTAAEAHLVTDHDRAVHGSNWWPSSITDGITEHKNYTDKLFGTGTSNGKDWCPEEGCHFGQGSAGNFVPAEAEAWYINMYWKTKPPKGTRFLVIDPRTGKTIVAAGGYETGPNSCDHMGGAVYEIHKHFGTGHNSTLTFGKMKNQDLNDKSLPYGPIDCSK